MKESGDNENSRSNKKCSHTKEYTQEQSAENLMVSRQTISNWENGKSIINAKNLFKLSYLYNVKVDNFSLPYVRN